MSLYRLTNDWITIQQMIEEGEEPERFADTLDAIDESLEAKAESIYYVIRNTESDINGMKAEEERLAEKRKSAENKVRTLKDYLQWSMEQRGERKLKNALFTASIQKNPMSIDVQKPDLIPRRYYQEQEPKLNKKMLMERIKAGDEIPGVATKQTESIRIR